MASGLSLRSVRKDGVASGTGQRGLSSARPTASPIFSHLVKWHGCNMHVIAAETLRAFAVHHSFARASVGYWLKVTKGARWTSSQDLMSSFPSAKVINAERVRFELAGNTFRLVCRINYRSGAVFIMFLGTHEEYDAIDAETVGMF